MRPIRYLIFSLFNLFYQNGNNENTDEYAYSIVIILVWELFTFLLGIELLSLFLDFNIFKNLVSLFGGTRHLAMAFLMLVVPPNYYFFIKKKRLDVYYEEFKDAEEHPAKSKNMLYLPNSLLANMAGINDFIKILWEALERMMRLLKYLVFLIFNALYQDGKNEKMETYFYSIAILVILQFLTILIGIDFLNQFVGSNIFNLLESFLGSEDGVVSILLLPLFPINYFIFMKGKRFNRYFNEFKDDPINTTKNRKIGYTCIMLYLPVMIFIGRFLL
jgi:hypothetical protein